VKISLPIDNVIDVEHTQMIEFADTCKIRVIDNDETYAIDEVRNTEPSDCCCSRTIANFCFQYFFSFFTFGREAIDVLKILVEDASSGNREVEKLVTGQPGQNTKATSRPSSSQSIDDVPPNLGDLPSSRARSEVVKATLSPLSASTSNNASPRSSTDESTRPTMEALHPRGRKTLDQSTIFSPQRRPRSFSGSSRSSIEESTRPSKNALHPRARKTLERSTILSPQRMPRSFSGSPKPISRRHEDEKTDTLQESSDSFLQSSMEDPSYSNIAASSHEDNSASQILKDSVVFHSPTMRRSPTGSLKGDAKGKARADPSREQSGSNARSIPHHAATTGQFSLGPDHQLDPQQAAAASTPTLQSITKMGTYPIERAGAVAAFLNQTSKKVSNMLATESMGYVEKVSGMWKGGRKHYDEPSGLRPDEDELERDSEGMIQTSMERFRAHFALPETEKLQATYFGHILRVLPLYGKIYISDRSFCFRSLLPGTRTKLILPLKDIETVHKEKGFRFGYQGLVVVIRGHEEIFFEFGQADVRDDCAVTMLQALEMTRYLKQRAESQDEDDDGEADTDEKSTAAAAERDALRKARRAEWPEHDIHLPRYNSCLSDSAPLLLDETDASMLSFKPSCSLRITCLTIGSRGDVQPYIALCKALMEQGHKVRIATHAEFQGWIESHGIEFKRVEGDPSELMRLCIENGTFTWAFLKEANSTFRGWLDELLDSAYTACQDSDVLIEAPSAMAGIHIAEKLGIPYFRAFTMPWTRTRAYPHAFIMPEHKMGGAYNYMTYVMFDNIFWKATAHQVNKWRNTTLGLPNTSLEKMQPNKVPFMYSFSPSVVAPPLDFSDWIRVSGYWFLDEGDTYDPPKELDDFMKKARKDGKKIVYVGFGSIIVNDPGKMTQEVIDAVLKADVRCILSKGWSDRVSTKQDGGKPRADEPVMPPEIHVIKSAPHDWLFRRIDAAAHHGGSGTTGASLRAGIPTIIRPFFGDQFFFASRVEDLGVGVWVKKWGTKNFGRALWEATRNERMLSKARLLGEQIRKVSQIDPLPIRKRLISNLLTLSAGERRGDGDPVPVPGHGVRAEPGRAQGWQEHACERWHRGRGGGSRGELDVYRG
jgi:sterol 3beta-glucosyltransferase